MSTNLPTSDDLTSRDSLKKYYNNLMKEAEEQRQKREDKLQQELMNDDPLSINYARWSTEDEFKAGFEEVPIADGEADAAGVPLFCSESNAYVDTSDSHSLIIGSSGSKKTRLLIMPSILLLGKAGESMVVTDPKAELYERTSGYLKDKGYKVYCVSFRDDAIANAWNPFEAPLKFFKQNKFDLAVGLLNDFASTTIPSDTRRGADPFWDDTARATFMGLLMVLFLLADDKEEINIHSLLRLKNELLNEDSKSRDLLKKIIRLAGTDNLITNYLSIIASAPEKTFGSIVATLNTHMMKFIIRPSLTDMLCHNDIRFSEIGREKTAVFLVMPDEKTTYHGLISLFVHQCYEYLIFEAQKCEGKTLPVRVNFLLDEFASLPQIKEFPSMISAARSRNIRFNIVVQSEKQLQAKYNEEAATIKGNCNNWIYLYSREFPTLVELSNLCGSQKSGKPLVSTSRLQRLDKNKGEALVLSGRKYPFISTLKDIDEYEHDPSAVPVHEPHDNSSQIKLLDLQGLMKSKDDKYIQGRLNSTDGTAKEGASVYYCRRFGRDRLRLHIKPVPKKLPLQSAADESDALYAAAHEWFDKHSDDFSWKRTVLSDSLIGTVSYKDPSDAKPLADESLPVRTIPSTVGMIDENIAVTGNDANELERLAKAIYAQLIAGKTTIPFYLDLRGFEPPEPFLVKDKSDREVNHFLTMLLTQRLFEVEPEFDGRIPSGVFGERYRELFEYFDRASERPAVTIVLHGLEQANYVTDAVFHSWLLGAQKNVKIIAVGTDDKKILEKNCFSLVDINDETTHIHSFILLRFDDKTNEVITNHSPSPTCVIRLTDKAPR